MRSICRNPANSIIPGDWHLKILAGFDFQTGAYISFQVLQIHYEFSKTFFDQKCWKKRKCNM